MSTKRVSLVLLTLFVSLFIIQFVFAADDVSVNVKTRTTVTVGDNLAGSSGLGLPPFIENYVISPISSTFTGDTTPSVAVVKFLFFLLCTILVLAIFPLLPVLKTIDGMWYLKYPFAIIVGYLFVAFFNSIEIFALATQYTAAGFVILFALPLLILTFWSVELLKGDTKETNKNIFNLLSYYLVWGVYICYAVYKLGSLIYANGNWDWGTYGWFLIASIIYAILMMTVFKRWLRSFFESEEEARKHGYLHESINEVLSGKEFLATVGKRATGK